MTDYVKIDRRQWLRELYSCIEEHFSADDMKDRSSSPFAALAEKYLDWAASAYNTKDVPPAWDLAYHYAEHGEFISRQKEFDDDVDDDAWEDYCKQKKCIVWDENYG